ncbi:MAG: YggT family protein [Thermoflexus sp.]|jgi:YggT family protein|nr:YggT family protein [Thermoflexus sp.]
MSGTWISLVDALVNFYVLLIVIYVFSSWIVMDPWHPARRFLGSLVEPVLDPLRRYIPPVGGLDLTPLVAILLIQLAGQLLKALLAAGL